MKPDRIAHAVGSWTLVLMGIAHLIGHVAGQRAIPTEAQASVLAAMRGLPVMPGSSRTIDDIWNGLSLSFSLFPALVGIVAWMALRLRGDDVRLMRALRIAFVGFLAIETVISARWFILPPTVFLAVAALSFTLSLALTPRAAGGTT